MFQSTQTAWYESNMTAMPTVRREDATATMSLYDVSLPTRRAIRKLYRHLIELTYLLRPWLDNPEYPTTMAEMRLRTFVRTAKWPRIIETLQRMSPSLQYYQSHRVQRIIHDIRGGALTSLSLYLAMAESGDLLARDIPQMVLLANDHAKILRSMIVDLDRIRYTQDELFVPQPVQTIITTWHQKEYRMTSGHAAHVSVSCTVADAYIAESTVELAAFERIVYNLINNAVRHSAEPEVHIQITAPDATPAHASICVRNAMSLHQYHRLQRLCPDGDFQRLIYESLSTTNGGLGLGICADIVAHMFRFDNVADVIAARAFWVDVQPDAFSVHFVWPLRMLHQ